MNVETDEDRITKLRAGKVITTGKTGPALRHLLRLEEEGKVLKREVRSEDGKRRLGFKFRWLF